MNIDGVPEKISRQKLLDLIRSLGLDPVNVYRLEAYGNVLRVTVFATDKNGKQFYDGGDHAAMHQIAIRVED